MLPVEVVIDSMMNSVLKNDISKKSHPCPECGKVFTKKSRLNRHYLIHTGERPHTCDQCGKSFTQKGSLKIHLLVHTGEKFFNCSVEGCGRGFARSNDLKKHSLMHDAEKCHSCPDCGKIFLKESTLKSHSRVHKEKTFTCEFCGKSFSKKSSLDLHILVHTGEKSHVCLDCGKKFARKGHLKEHSQIHSGEKAHTCLKCGEKSFMYKQSLRKHFLKCNGTMYVESGKAQNDKKPKKEIYINIDSMCEKIFIEPESNTKEINMEKDEKSEDTEEENNSEYSYSNVINKRNNIVENFDVSDFYDTQLNEEENSEIMDSIEEEKKKSYACEECDKRFSRKAGLRDHLQAHTGERLYSCSKCSKPFMYRQSLKRHFDSCTNSKFHETQTSQHNESSLSACSVIDIVVNDTNRKLDCEETCVIKKEIDRTSNIVTQSIKCVAKKEYNDNEKENTVSEINSDMPNETKYYVKEESANDIDSKGTNSCKISFVKEEEFDYKDINDKVKNVISNGQIYYEEEGHIVYIKQEQDDSNQYD